MPAPKSLTAKKSLAHPDGGRLIRVLVLERETYRLHGEFRAGDQATSVLLPGFTVAVADVWAAAALQHR